MHERSFIAFESKFPPIKMKNKGEEKSSFLKE